MNKLSIWKILFLVFLIIGTIYILGKQKPYITNSGKIFGTFYNITYSSDIDTVCPSSVAKRYPSPSEPVVG